MQPEGMWLKTTSQLLPGLGLGAHFIICFRFEPYPAYRAWGFWSNLEWIGPRHTNFPDGSICAFDLEEDTWLMGDPIVELLDLYSVWALRQLHLRILGRWPGPQSVPHIYERLEEFRDNELCGCGKTRHLTYAKCCKPKDLKWARLPIAIRFNLWAAGGLRKPPRGVLRFSAGTSGPPPIPGPLPPMRVRF